MIQATDDLELLAPIALSVVCFRYAPAALRDDPAGTDALNKAIMEEVQAGGEARVAPVDGAGGAVAG